MTPQTRVTFCDAGLRRAKRLGEIDISFMNVQTGGYSEAWNAGPTARNANPESITNAKTIENNVRRHHSTRQHNEQRGGVNL